MWVIISPQPNRVVGPLGGLFCAPPDRTLGVQTILPRSGSLQRSLTRDRLNWPTPNWTINGPELPTELSLEPLVLSETSLDTSRLS